MNFQEIIFVVDSNKVNKVNKDTYFIALAASPSEVADIKEEPEIKHNSNISRKNLKNILEFTLQL